MASSNYVSLETARRLKTANFPQQSDFWYGERRDYDSFDADHWALCHFSERSQKNIDRNTMLAAPTAQEIADHLPSTIDDFYDLTINKIDMGYRAAYVDVSEMGSTKHNFLAPTMAEAVALLWLKLHAN